MITKRKIKEELKSSFIPIDSEYSEPHILVINGKRVKTRSGKSLWKTKAAAKNALINHMRIIKSEMKYRVCYAASLPYYKDLGRYFYRMFNQIIDEMSYDCIKNIKIMSLKEYNESETKNKA